MSEKPTQDEIIRAILSKVERSLREIQSGRMTCSYGLECFATSGGIQPESIHETKKTRMPVKG